MIRVGGSITLGGGSPLRSSRFTLLQSGRYVATLSVKPGESRRLDNTHTVRRASSLLDPYRRFDPCVCLKNDFIAAGIQFVDGLRYTKRSPRNYIHANQTSMLLGSTRQFIIGGSITIRRSM